MNAREGVDHTSFRIHKERLMSASPLRLKVASPCSADWSSMEGDETCRFCRLCQKNVYNLAGLSDVESRQLMEDHDGSVCVRFYQRSDGTVLTSNCPVGAADGRRRIRKRVTSLAFAGFVAAGIWNFARQTTSSQTTSPQAETPKELVVDRWIEGFRQLIGLSAMPAPSVRSTAPEELIMGEICPPGVGPGDEQLPPDTLPEPGDLDLPPNS
ncbi:MAG: hypothetical protein O2820_06420 [Planctomycetota bacterium]|nr:hypothetical protein [Planctomycetota bacterium]MDA1248842.1 hypothetical protein [Planctomycetota bacterium]